MTAAPSFDQRPPSPYAAHMPLLRDFAALATTDPRRARLREELILAFLPVVKNLAGRHAGRNAASVEDLTQTGTVALINAIDRWDPARARGEFLGYLVPCVRGEMLRWFRDRTWAMRVSRRITDLTVAIERAVGPLSLELGRAPRPSELAAHLGADLEDVVEALQAKANQHAGPLDLVDAVTGRSLMDQLGSLDRDLHRAEIRHLVWPLLDALPDRERRILALRFFGELTQAQIAEEVGLSQMHISRLLKRTLDMLRQALPDDVRTV